MSKKSFKIAISGKEVDDIPETYVAEYRGIKLLRRGSITHKLCSIR